MSAMARPWLGVVLGAALACAVWTAAGALKPIKPVLAQGQTGIVSVAYDLACHGVLDGGR